MLKKIGALVVLLLLLCMACFPTAGLAVSEDEDVIRVAWPIQEGLSDIDEYGNYAGYSYEYLQKIAQYTGWTYEFVEYEDNEINDALTLALDMLEKGEVDIMGGIVRIDSTEEKFDFPSYNYGMSYTTLLVPNESTTFYNMNDLVQKTLRVAVYERGKTGIKNLQQFCDANKITLKTIPCADEQEMLMAVRDLRADALIGKDLSPVAGMRTVARFAGMPYYFAVTGGNSDVVSGMNAAMFDIQISNPYFSVELYKKYFAEKMEKAVFSPEEAEYIEEKGMLRVLISPDAAPFQYFDANGVVQGVTVDVMDVIAEQTGLYVEYVQATSHAEFMDAMDEGDIDLIVGIPYNYEFGEQYDTVLTNPFVTAPMTMLMRQGAEEEELEESVLALPYGSFWAAAPKFERVDVYETLEDCIVAVSSGRADFTYGNMYSMEYYARQSMRNNVAAVPFHGDTQGFCIGVVRPADTNLIAIINMVIRTIPVDESMTMLFRNLSQGKEKVTFLSFVEANPIESVVLLGIVALVIIVLFVILLLTRSRANRQLKLDNQRYIQMSDFANEFLFEYDFAKDRLTLSQKCADMMGSEKVVGNLSRKIQEWMSDEQERNAFWNVFCRREGTAGEVVEVRMKVANGEMRWFDMISTVILGADGKPQYTAGKLIDIQEEKQEKERLIEKSKRDALTGLYNVESGREQIVEYLQDKQSEERGAFLICDIDYFKEVNDKLGHFNGDKVLGFVADTLRVLFRQNDILVRLGGDEFIVFMKDVKHINVVVEKCASLCEKMKKTLQYEGKEHMLTLSVGVAIETEETRSYEQLYRCADAALYRVKEHGRDGFEVDDGKK